MYVYARFMEIHVSSRFTEIHLSSRFTEIRVSFLFTEMHVSSHCFTQDIGKLSPSFICWSRRYLHIDWLFCIPTKRMISRSQYSINITLAHNKHIKKYRDLYKNKINKSIKPLDRYLTSRLLQNAVDSRRPSNYDISPDTTLDRYVVMHFKFIMTSYSVKCI